ncbi:kinase-like protein [Fistulina hepatica ATCC 64428]|uniref:Kinase-like protein n=1 Tax=Fistulina hepatica ATCC 64428 TaxID=1128425 RepID=A0A0D7A1G9_9AGAR|nr:kinase-like protein [Fistulina hepatica ATCC 64428]
MLLGWLFSIYVELRTRYENAFLDGWSTRITWFPFGLLLKIGQADIGLEADTLRFIRHHTSIPVPRVIASATHGEYAYTLMEHVKGLPLEGVWPSLDAQQRASVVAQLRDFVGQLRHLRPPPHVLPDTIGSLNGQALRDSRVSCYHPIGPFETESAFHDRLLVAADTFLDREISEPIRARMRDDHHTVFTHGDLTPRNIIVQGHVVVAIVDWEESGWMPEYWELVKAKWSPGMEKGSDWNEAIWEILSRDNEEDWLRDKQLSDWMVGAF